MIWWQVLQYGWREKIVRVQKKRQARYCTAVTFYTETEQCHPNKVFSSHQICFLHLTKQQLHHAPDFIKQFISLAIQKWTSFSCFSRMSPALWSYHYSIKPIIHLKKIIMFSTENTVTMEFFFKEPKSMALICHFSCWHGFKVSPNMLRHSNWKAGSTSMMKLKLWWTEKARTRPASQATYFLKCPFTHHLPLPEANQIRHSLVLSCLTVTVFKSMCANMNVRKGQ